jgi:hypothetical protein
MTDTESYFKSLPEDQAIQFLKTPQANELLYRPLRAPAHIEMLQRTWNVDIVYTQRIWVEEQIRPLINIDTMIINERRRRAKRSWGLFLCITKLLARRPRRRLLQFENIPTAQKVYTIVAGTRQGLIEKLFERGILQPKLHIIKCLLKSQVSNLPIGSIGRKSLQGANIPKSWYALYIRGRTEYQDSRELDMLAKFTTLRIQT